MSYEELYLSGSRYKPSELSRPSLSQTRLQDVSTPAVSLSAATAQPSVGRTSPSRSRGVPSHPKEEGAGADISGRSAPDGEATAPRRHVSFDERHEKPSRGRKVQAVDDNEWRLIVTRVPGHRPRPASYTLADAFRVNPACFDGEKLRLVSCRITVLSPLPRSPLDLTPQVLVLFLSNNDIASLNGIESFRNLQTLSLSNNLLRYLEELRVLSELKKLRKLSLLGNPVVEMPQYRARVLLLCPQLTSLDGIAVTAEERTSSIPMCRKTDLALDMLSTNELKAVVLAHLSRLSRCLRELRTTVMGPFRSIRGNHIGTESADTAASMGSVLQRCMFGGVFRRLQMTATAHFRRRTQDICLRISGLLLSKMSPSQRPSPAMPSEISRHWDDVFGEYLKRQQMAALLLIDSPSTDPDRVLDALEELELFDARTVAGNEGPGRDFCGIGHHCEVRLVDDVPINSAPTKNIEKSLEAQTPRIGLIPSSRQMVAVDDLYLPRQPLKSVRQSALRRSTSMETIEDPVVLKYNQLLQNLDSEQQGSTVSKMPQVVNNAKAVKLPPQQEEPRDSVDFVMGVESIPSSSIPRKLQESAQEEIVTSRIKVAVHPQDLTTPNVCQTTKNDTTAMEISKMLFDDEKEKDMLERLHRMIALEETPWPQQLNEFEADAFIGTAPKEVIRGSSAANMRDARRLCEAIQRDLDCRHQDVNKMLQINARLRTDVECTVASAEASAADAARKLSDAFATQDLLQNAVKQFKSLLQIVPEKLKALEVSIILSGGITLKVRCRMHNNR